MYVFTLTCGHIADLAHKPILAIKRIAVGDVDWLVISPHQTVVMVQPGQQENSSHKIV